MRISDWSSDVCSSDLRPVPARLRGPDLSNRRQGAGNAHDRLALRPNSYRRQRANGAEGGNSGRLANRRRYDPRRSDDDRGPGAIEVAWSAVARWRLRPACLRSAARRSHSIVGANRADKAIMIAILEIGLAELLDAAGLDADSTEIDHFLIHQDLHHI